MKDQTRNIETFKVGAKRVNAFDFHKHQGEMQAHRDDLNQHGSNKAETRAERTARLTKEAHQKVLRKKKRR